ncbi:MAG: helix-turn-helix domain-containing protein [Lachnospiraceae bacterium]|nr:helix-turn-helix domain-containing protein [Lachnospiraceae bacterium]
MYMKEYPVVDARATGQRIRELRRELRLTVSQIRDFMGFESDQAVYKWQRGDSLPTVDNLYALSVLFNTTIDNIIRGSRPEEDEKSSSVHAGELKILPL